MDGGKSQGAIMVICFEKGCGYKRSGTFMEEMPSSTEMRAFSSPMLGR
jgi:hypothetical protein